MVIGATRLLAERGLQETSFSEVLELTGAPRGSIYHHFPGGKDELIASAVDLAGDHAIDLIAAFDGLDATEVTTRFIGMWRSVLVQSDFTAGCSVLAVTVSTDSSDLLGHVSDVFRNWRIRLAQVLTTGGLDPADAARFATLLIAATEGAVVLSRAEKSLEPFELVAADLTRQSELLRSGSTPG
jgi:AcrR family transcriptional regulator